MITSFVNPVFSQPHSQRTFNSILHCGVSFEVMVTTQPQIHHNPPHCLLLILNKRRQSLLLNSSSLHVMHTTRPEPNTIKTNQVAHMKTCTQIKQGGCFVFLLWFWDWIPVVCRWVFLKHKRRIQSHTMGVYPINIKKSELYSNLNWVPTTNNRVQKTMSCNKLPNNHPCANPAYFWL